MSGDPQLPLDKRDAERLAAIEARLAALEGAAPTTRSTQIGGSFKLENPSGQTVFLFGDVSGIITEPGQQFGVEALDSLGSIALWWSDTTRGLVYPAEQHQWYVPVAQTVTSGTFVAVAEAELFMPQGDVLYATAAIITPAATTAEVRIAALTGEATDPVAVPASSSGLVVFRWLHPFSVGMFDSAHPRFNPTVQWQVRRTTGVGNVSAFPPRALTICSHELEPQLRLADSHGHGQLIT